MSVSVIVLPILILLILALSVLGYYICYKIMINRRMKQQESANSRGSQPVCQSKETKREQRHFSWKSADHS